MRGRQWPHGLPGELGNAQSLRYRGDSEAARCAGRHVLIPKRIFYIDSEGWFITASDQYNSQGQLWKTIATFHAYRDRAEPNARVAIYPFKRIFQTALVDEDVTSGFSTVVYSPGYSGHDDSMFINMGAVDRTFFTPQTMVQLGH